MLRRYAEMAGVLDQALAIVPKDVETRVARALVELDWHADPATVAYNDRSDSRREPGRSHRPSRIIGSL